MPNRNAQATSGRRSDGQRTHTAILDVATRLASVEGIEGLTIGRLADELGVSKSGVYAHFGSKEQLQLETVAAARAIFEREVMHPALNADDALERLEALCDSYLSYVERDVFPGGCFFAALLAEMDARSGPIHDLVLTGEQSWQNAFVELARTAQRHRKLAADVDAAQLAFELQACLELSNYHYVLFKDPRIIGRGREVVAAIINRSRPSQSEGVDARSRETS